VKPIDAAVTLKLGVQGGHQEALALWKAIWAAYERGGAEGAKTHLAGLRELPEDDADELDDEADS